MLRVLRVNDLADVTLACVDGQQVKAHKVILAVNRKKILQDLAETRGKVSNLGPKYIRISLNKYQHWCAFSQHFFCKYVVLRAELSAWDSLHSLHYFRLYHAKVSALSV